MDEARRPTRPVRDAGDHNHSRIPTVASARTPAPRASRRRDEAMSLPPPRAAGPSRSPTHHGPRRLERYKMPMHASVTRPSNTGSIHSDAASKPAAAANEASRSRESRPRDRGDRSSRVIASKWHVGSTDATAVRSQQERVRAARLDDHIVRAMERRWGVVSPPSSDQADPTLVFTSRQATISTARVESENGPSPSRPDACRSDSRRQNRRLRFVRPLLADCPRDRRYECPARQDREPSGGSSRRKCSVCRLRRACGIDELRQNRSFSTPGKGCSD